MSKYITEKTAFIEKLLPLLGELDFVFTAEKMKELHRKETIYERKGMYYSVLSLYHPRLRELPAIVEFRIHAFYQDPRLPRIRPDTDESCFVYISDSYEKKRPGRLDVVIEGYFIESYKKEKLQTEKCFYCGYVRGCHKPSHNKTKKHLSNRARVESELAAAAKIPQDCMFYILSYL